MEVVHNMESTLKHSHIPDDQVHHLAAHVAKALNIAGDPVVLDYINLSLDLISLFASKQADYGPGNIAKFGEAGVLVRVSDKVERLINLTRTGQAEAIPRNEAIHDSWEDLALYGVIALMCRYGLWPRVEHLNERLVGPFTKDIEGGDLVSSEDIRP